MDLPNTNTNTGPAFSRVRVYPALPYAHWRINPPILLYQERAVFPSFSLVLGWRWSVRCSLQQPARRAGRGPGVVGHDQSRLVTGDVQTSGERRAPTRATSPISPESSGGVGAGTSDCSWGDRLGPAGCGACWLLVVHGGVGPRADGVGGSGLVVIANASSPQATRIRQGYRELHRNPPHRRLSEPLSEVTGTTSELTIVTMPVVAGTFLQNNPHWTPPSTARLWPKELGPLGQPGPLGFWFWKALATACWYGVGGFFV